MALPIAKFAFDPNLLLVQFSDLSENLPTSWAWDFGDPASGGANTSALQNPSHTFTSPARYTVTLDATNADGTDQTIYIIIVSNTPVLPLSIVEMIDCKVPVGVTIDANCKINSIVSWRIFLQPLLVPKISDANAMDETKWPALANLLIADLVVRDIILDASTKATLANSISSSGSSTKPLKKLVTGPSEAEWFNAGDFWADIFKPGGSFDMVTRNACHLSARIRVTLPFCQALAQSPIVPIKSGRPVEPTLTFPFGNSQEL